MTLPFADRFAEAGTTIIHVDGELLHSIVYVAVEGPVTLVFVRAACRSDRPQGLVVDCGGASLEVGPLSVPRATLWSDTAPETVTATINEPGPATLRMWNTWRDDRIEHAWVGWAAMKRTDRDGVTTLSCHDGHPDGDFDDLIVELTHGPTQDSGVLTTADQ